MSKIKLSDYAKLYNITYKTAYHWYRNNLIKEEISITPSGSIYVNIEDNVSDIIENKPLYIYCRVSSHNKKDDLLRQIERCKSFAENKGYSVHKTYKEIGSGMNDSRSQITKLLNMPVGVILVEHKDRLTRFGFNYINNLYERLGGKIIVINRDEFEEADLMKDLISIITSFCCRLYGMRRGYNKAKQIKTQINSVD